MPMVQDMKASGWMTNNMEKEQKYGMMVANISATTKMVIKKAKEFTSGLKATSTQETGTIIKLMVKVSTCGRMVAFILVTGNKT